MVGTRSRHAIPRKSLSLAVEKATRSMAGRRLATRAAIEPLEVRTLLAAGDPIISEFMADNTTGLTDGNGVRGDWIEIHNPGATAINLQGWHLTDNAANPNLYTFPSFTIPAGGYRVVFATSESTPYVDSAGYPHTNFALGKGGEYLGLSKPDGTITSEFGPQFPPQTSNVSYGVGPAGGVTTIQLNSGAAGKSLTPTGPIGSGWTGTSYNDSAWTTVTPGIGFEANGLPVAALTQEAEPNEGTTGANNAITSFAAYPGNLYQLGFNGSIASGTDVDYFKIGALQAGDVITVTAGGRGSAPLPDGVLEVFRVGDLINPVVSDDNSGPGLDAIVKRFAVTAGDTYYIRVRSNASYSGDYRVGLQLENAGAAPATGAIVTAEGEPNSTFGTADDLSAAWRAVNYRSHIDGGNATTFGSTHDWFKYQFNAGDVVTVYVDSTSTVEASVFLRDAAGNAVASEDGSSTPGATADFDSYIYSYVVPTTAVYYVDAAKVGTATGTYTLDVYLATSTAPPHPANLVGQYATSVQSETYNKNASNYLRVPFNVVDPARLQSLTLRMKYEDGFAAYLNGVEVARRNAPGTVGTPLAYNAAASSDRAPTLATTFEDIDISAFRSALVAGNNVLAIQGLNSSAASDDFLIVPQLTAAVATDGVKQFFYTPTPGQPNIAGSGVVINEIHYDPDVKTEHVDFLELYNNSTQTISLANWQFTKGVTYKFATGASLAPGQYLVLAENAAQFQAKFGFAPFGQYVGALSGEGDQVRLVDVALNTVDDVTYGAGFPWPTVGDPLSTPGTGGSIQLINPGLDNDLGGNWRSALPTPAAQNGVFAANAPPAVRQVNHAPTQPTANQPVTITAKVTDPDGVASVTLQYQVNAPGNYVPYQLVNTSFGVSPNPAYYQNWVTLAMYDDGTHGDSTPGDGTYAAQVPASVNQNRTLIRYEVSATDQLGATVSAPYADDPQLNFAYYVYNQIPSWTASIIPGGSSITFGPEVMSSVPAYTFITTKQDHANALHVPVGTATPQMNGYGGEDYLWAGTLVYDGKVYDNVRWRARGGVWRYAMGKNMWKIDFNRNHEFDYRDQWGNSYPVKWKKLNLGAVIQQGDYGQRGEQGLFEYAGFKLFNLAGSPAPATSPVTLRIVEDASETGPTSSQYDDDFQGIYLAVEQEDGQFLDAHDLPDGNFYKMEGGTGTLNNQGPNDPTNKSDLTAFQSGMSSATEQWWRDNVNLDAYFGYRAIVEAIHHWDIGFGKNYFYYRNPQTGKWEEMSWDLDLTWTTTYEPANGDNEPLKRMLQFPGLMRDYQNKLREVQDLLWNPEQVGQLLDEYAALITKPGANGARLAEADRRMWDYNPIMTSPYVNLNKAGNYHYYTTAPGNTFLGFVQKLKNYVSTRDANYLDPRSADPLIPNKPSVTYSGPAGQPIDQLAFTASDYSSANASFAAMKWRIAEVYDPNNPTYANWQGERPYEIRANWESPELTTFNATLNTIPAGTLIPGRTYRVRVRMKDATGRWSNWSDPVQFVAGDAAASINALRVTEIMYHPAAPPAGSPYTPDDFEYVELLNTSDANLDLSGVRFTAGIDFTFPSGYVLAPGQRTLVVSNLAALQSRYGTSINNLIAGTFANGTNLSDSGERLRLAGPVDQTILDFSYSDAWYPQTDGDGFSLVIVNPSADPSTWGDKDAWRVGQLVNGAPGTADPGLDPNAVVVNELLANPGVGRAFIEIKNTTGTAIDLSNWFLSDSADNLRKFELAAGTVLQPGALLTLYADTSFGVGASPFALSPLGGTIYLTSAGAAGTLLGYRDAQDYGASDGGVAQGRYVKSTGKQDFTPLASSTPAAENAQPLVGPIVINEVMYNPPAGGNEYIELRNTSNRAVDISGWQLGGVTFTFPAGTIIPAHGYFLVVPILPADFRANYNVPPATQVFGPFAGLLDDAGESVEIRKPGAPVNGVTPYVTVDRVSYDATFPWPASPNGAGPALQRRSQLAYGNDVANWTASATAGGSPGRPNAPATAVAAHDWSTAPGKITVSFNEDVSGTLGAGSLTLQNFSGGAVPATTYTWNAATLTATWAFAQVPADGNYRATLSGAGIADWSGVGFDGDADGQPGGNQTLDFFQLAGDANHDRTVNFTDLLALAKSYNQSGMTYTQGDFNGDGVVNFSDLLILAKGYNSTLPAAGAVVVTGAPVSAAAFASLLGTTPTAPAPATTPPPPSPKPASTETTKKPAAKPSLPVAPPARPKPPAKPPTFSKSRIR